MLVHVDPNQPTYQLSSSSFSGSKILLIQFHLLTGIQCLVLWHIPQVHAVQVPDQLLVMLLTNCWFV
jgi:hypothetical protein